MSRFLDSFDFEKPLSLYIHVPFCIKKCSYCAFFSTDRADMAIKDFYTSRIVRDIKEVVRRMKGKPFYTAFVGGGNPGCLGFSNLRKIARAVCANGRPVEFTTEMNPESLTDEMAELFPKYFNRLSMGVQSLEEEALAFLGRNADMKTTIEGLKKSQTLNCRLSYDLITCLGDFHRPLEDVKKIITEFPAGHLSVYALTLEEGTPLFKKQPILPNEEKQAEILEEIWEFLKSKGYEHYEVSNFAKPGNRSLHNSVYWDYNQYLGLGPGAASTGFSNGKAVRINIERDITEFIKRGSFALAEYEELTKQEEKEEFILMGLRHRDGLDLNRLKNDFGVEVGKLPEGFFIENNRLKPTDKGLLTADAAALCVDSIW